MAGTFEQIGGTALGAAGFAVGGVPGQIIGSYTGKKLGGMADKSPEEKQLEAMQKAQFAKLKRGDNLGLSQAEKSSMTMGTQQNAAALQQQMAAQNERLAASGTVSPAAVFQAQQMQGKQAQDAVAQGRMQAEQQSQSIAERRNREYSAMLRQRAMEEQQKRGIRAKEGEMVVQETPEADKFSQYMADELPAGSKGSVYGMFNG